MDTLQGNSNDTIAAISTPMNRSGGGVGIVRISGDRALTIARGLFRPMAKEAGIEDRKFVLGHIIEPENGLIVDEAFLVFMKSPRTYTREDVVEFHCHGGARIVQHVLEMIMARGARIARPGEFTLRAFMNGRIDLTRAEAVLDLIQAKSSAGLRIAARQIAGALEKRIHALLDELAGLETLIEAQIDFPEEGIPGDDAQDFRNTLNRLLLDMEKLLSTFRQGRGIADGFCVTIAGLPNVGKSSLLNRLLQRDRAIVSPIPGTTRDYLDETMELDGIPVQLTDTAGIGTARNIIEKESALRSREKIRQSDLVILVLDSSRRISRSEKEEIAAFTKGIPLLIVLNKEDIRKFDHRPWTESRFPRTPTCITCAINGRGIKDLSDMIPKCLMDGSRDSEDELILTSVRHAEALNTAAAALRRARALADVPQMPLTLMAMDVKGAMEALREILGIQVSEDVLERIFQRFCIGK